MAQRVHQHTPAVISVSFPDQYGEPREVTNPSVTVRNSASTMVLSGPAVRVDSETPTYQVSLPVEATKQLDRLIATWTADDAHIETVVEIVGGFYFGLHELRSAEFVLQDVTKYPDDDILLRVRQAVEVEAESICNRAFVPRFGRTVISGSGARHLNVGIANIRKIRNVKVNNVALGAAAVNAMTPNSNGYIEWNTFNDVWDLEDYWRDGNRFAYGRSNITIDFEFGMDSPPDDLKRAAMVRLRDRLTAARSSIPDRALSYSDESGTYSLFTPGLRGAHTAIPEVDEVYSRYVWQPQITSAEVLR